MAKIRPKWGVSVFRDAVIGPVKFQLLPSTYLEEEPDPMNLSHWQYVSERIRIRPTRLFQNRRNASIFADGARCTRDKIISAWGEDMTVQFDYQEG